jgi:HK97 family phage prohead protease
MIELRHIPFQELRAEPDPAASKPDDGGQAVENRLVGYGIVYDSPTRLFEDYFEQFAPGAFADFLAKNPTPDVRALLEHDRRSLLARTSNQTLTLKEERQGLAFEMHVNIDTSQGRDAVAMVKRQDIKGMSVGFRSVDERMEEREDGTYLRTVLKADLDEISLTSIPAYDDTSIEQRVAPATLEQLKALKSRPHPAALARRRQIDLLRATI